MSEQFLFKEDFDNFTNKLENVNSLKDHDEYFKILVEIIHNSGYKRGYDDAQQHLTGKSY